MAKSDLAARTGRAELRNRTRRGAELEFVVRRGRAVGVSLGSEECYRRARRSGDPRARVMPTGQQPRVRGDGRRRRRRARRSAHSMHGWGKAVDLTDAGRSLTFASPGYAFMKSAAAVGRLEPSRVRRAGRQQRAPSRGTGSGSATAAAAACDRVRGDAVALLPSADDRGYATVTGLGARRPARQLRRIAARRRIDPASRG